MPSPFPFLNLGRAAAKAAVLETRNRPVNSKDLAGLKPGLARFERPGEPGRPFMASKEQMLNRFVTEQLEPAFESTLTRLGLPAKPPLIDWVEMGTGPDEGGIQFIIALGERPDDTLRAARELGLIFKSPISIFTNNDGLFSLPKDPIMRDRPFLHE